tara:strand:+ start:2969 stop:3553 length:585 start_codon:yes stop_codon:yes gene_type:complete
MATYNGAIEVRICTEINIPQPGVVQELVFDAGSSYDNTGPQPIITGLPAATTQLLVQNNVSGGDVIYATDTTTGAEYIFQIEYIDVPTDTIVLFDICTPPAGTIAGADLVAEVYKGNYLPTTGTSAAPGGPTGAGNSEGYSILCDQRLNLIVLTVNNDLISITYAQDTPNDLQVVKVLQNLTGGGNITALRIQQ